jgi:hypothetical protein
MDEAEKNAAIEPTSGVDLVRGRIRVFVDGDRRTELERKFLRSP